MSLTRQHPHSSALTDLRATLLLANARDQILNQKRLETYLASSATPNFDLTGKLTPSQSPGPRMTGRYRSPSKNGASGAATPRDLNARVKILELYTLHVLIRNNEWDYAREFISASAILDDERREAFLQALESLQEEQAEQERLEEEERQRQEDQLRRDVEIAKRLKAENEERERKRLEEERLKREGSEVDYGVEKTPSVAGSSKGSSRRRSSAAPRPSKSALSRPQNRAPAPAPQTLTGKAGMVLSRLRGIIDQLATSLNHNPVMAMRLLAFIMGLILMLGHAGIRARFQRIVGASWGKVKATAGMGTKVSYI